MTISPRTEVSGEWRLPRNLLTKQDYGGHVGIHDDATASGLGLEGGAIEGPTHFSQFDPLLAQTWGGERWFSRGVLSAHFQSICAEGEKTRARAVIVGDEAEIVTEKQDGTAVLSGSARIGPGSTAVGRRLSDARHLASPVIFEGWTPGRCGIAPERVVMDYDTHMGPLYPFSLNDKLETITESNEWYTSRHTPWGKPIIPTEMISVLALSTFEESGLVKAEPSVTLFLDLEIRMLGEPAFVGEPYVLTREVVALGESRRTESVWIKTLVSAESSGVPVAEVLLHEGAFKESYPGYPGI